MQLFFAEVIVPSYSAAAVGIKSQRPNLIQFVSAGAAVSIGHVLYPAVVQQSWRLPSVKEILYVPLTLRVP